MWIYDIRTNKVKTRTIFLARVAYVFNESQDMHTQ